MTAKERMTNTHLDHSFMVTHDNLENLTDWQIDKLYFRIYAEVQERNLGEYTEHEAVG